MEDSPFFWRLCQQRLELSDGRLRTLMLADAAAQRQHLGAAGWKRFQACAADHPAQQQLQQRLADDGIALLSLVDDGYPALLSEIADPPPLLYYRGRLELLERPSIAVVGSRRPSHSGERDAEEFARALAELGFSVVSGLALGVDGAAHRGALSVQGDTVAVLGCGVDVCYPRSHRVLYQQLGEQGLLLSEFAPGSPPLRHQFPKRNRIISGLSLGVLVVEAAERSGSLITAREALEQNREVFALPGSIHNPASRGCNALIRQGAQLVETVGDILDALSGWSLNIDGEAAVAESAEQISVPESAVYPLLGFEPCSLESLAQQSGLAPVELLRELGRLELEGWAQPCGAMWQRGR